MRALTTLPSLIRFTLLLFIKAFSKLFFTTEVSWVGEPPRSPFEDIRVLALMNHTSLMEPLYAAALPNSLLWQIASRGVFPGADITLNRPLVGRLFKWMAPKVITITRQRDETWDTFLRSLEPTSIVLLSPEGRMKRPNGLDKEGNPMTVRGGIADILWGMEDGHLLLAHSGGLHHVNTPGNLRMRLFQTIRLRFEKLDIAEYKRSLGEGKSYSGFKKAVVADLNMRLMVNGTASLTMAV